MGRAEFEQVRASMQKVGAKLLSAEVARCTRAGVESLVALVSAIVREHGASADEVPDLVKYLLDEVLEAKIKELNGSKPAKPFGGGPAMISA